MLDIPFSHRRFIIFRDDYMYTTHDHLNNLLKGKEQVPDDVVDVLIFMMCHELRINPVAYAKLTIITLLLALAI